MQDGVQGKLWCNCANRLVEGEEEFSIEPCSAASLVVFRQVSQIGDGLEALEPQLDLPSQPVHFEDSFGAGLLHAEGSKYEHILGAEPSERPHWFASLLLVFQA